MMKCVIEISAVKLVLNIERNTQNRNRNDSEETQKLLIFERLPEPF